MGTSRYIFRDARRLFCRHLGLSLLTLATAASVFFLVGGSSLLALNIRKLANAIQSDLVVQAYLPSEQAVNAVLARLRDNENIAEIRCISPQDGLDRLRSKMGVRSKAVSLLGENPLPWALEIKVRRASMVADVVHELSEISEIDDIMHSGALAERLAAVSALISKTSFVMMLIAVLISALVFYNTVQIAIYSRRREISVMLLVGATRSYVASPFILQGMMLGFFGALISIISLHYGQNYVFSIIDPLLPFLSRQLEWREVAMLYEIMLGAGVTMGWLCSLFPVHRHIRRASSPL